MFRMSVHIYAFLSHCGMCPHKIMETNHKWPDSICDNLVGECVVTNWVHTVHGIQTSCHKFIPSLGLLQTLLMVVTMWSQSNMKVHIPCILCKGEGSHHESPDDDVTKRKKTNVCWLQWTPSNQSPHHGQTRGLLLCLLTNSTERMKGCHYQILVPRSGTRWLCLQICWWIVVLLLPMSHHPKWGCGGSRCHGWFFTLF